MISVQEALKLILQHSREFGTEYVDIQQSIGRVLAESLCTDRDLPPYDRVTVDGVAIRYADFITGLRTFQLAGMAAAGTPQMILAEGTTGQGIEIMTGAILPQGADTVIKYEELKSSGHEVKIIADEVILGQNIHKQGLDSREGDILVPDGQRISIAEIGVAASIGKLQLLVKKLPRIAIVTTGDELVPIDVIPKSYQIRQSNGYVLQAMVEEQGLVAERIHLPDNQNLMLNHLEQIVHSFEVVLMSGGVSKGKLDFVPKVLEQLGVKQVFHQVAQRPGKPLWFGQHPQNQTVVFAFPGNPVSVTACALVYFIPWLWHSLQKRVTPRFKVKLAEPVVFKPSLDYFVPCKLQVTEQGLQAQVSAGHGSGDFANLVHQDGFVHLVNGSTVYPEGEIVDFIPYKKWFV